MEYEEVITNQCNNYRRKVRELTQELCKDTTKERSKEILESLNFYEKQLELLGY